MPEPALPGLSVQRLAAHLLDGTTAQAYAGELTGWLEESARFRAFADAHRDKIRKKLRGAVEPEALRDVRAELAVAHLLLRDRRIELAFEAYGSGRRGPDFTVTHRGDRAFNLEVTRLRRATGIEGPLLAKLRQLPPSVPNVLLLAIDADDARNVDVAAAAAALRARADAHDEEVFIARGLEGAREFHARYLRLGAVVAWCETAAAPEARAASWINRSARIAVPDRGLGACLVALRG